MKYLLYPNKIIKFFLQKFNINLRPGLYYGIARAASSHNKYSESIVNRLTHILSLRGRDLYNEVELKELIDSLGSLEDDNVLER